MLLVSAFQLGIADYFSNWCRLLSLEYIQGYLLGYYQAMLVFTLGGCGYYWHPQLKLSVGLPKCKFLFFGHRSWIVKLKSVLILVFSILLWCKVEMRMLCFHERSYKPMENYYLFWIDFPSVDGSSTGNFLLIFATIADVASHALLHGRRWCLVCKVPCPQYDSANSD